MIQNEQLIQFIRGEEMERILGSRVLIAALLSAIVGFLIVLWSHGMIAELAMVIGSRHV